MRFVLLIALAAAFVWWFIRKRAEARSADRIVAVNEFAKKRAELAATFLAAAGASGKPRGLRWVACDLDGPPHFAADRKTGALFALCGATIRFEAIPGGGMEEVEAVSNLRAATAVFVRRRGEWTTDGRVVFNLDPAGAIEHFRGAVEPIAVDGVG